MFFNCSGNNTRRIQMLREDDRNNCSLVLCNFDISLKVSRAVRDLLVPNPFDRKWEVEILDLELNSPLVILYLAQALFGKISSIKITGEFPKKFMLPCSFENLSVNLKKVSLKTAFNSLNLVSFISWLTQLKSLEELSLHHVSEHRGGLSSLKLFIFYFPSSQLRKLSLNGFVLHSFVSEKLKDWPILRIFLFFLALLRHQTFMK